MRAPVVPADEVPGRRHDEPHRNERRHAHGDHGCQPATARIVRQLNDGHRAKKQDDEKTADEARLDVHEREHGERGRGCHQQRQRPDEPPAPRAGTEAEQEDQSQNLGLALHEHLEIDASGRSQRASLLARVEARLEPFMPVCRVVPDGVRAGHRRRVFVDGRMLVQLAVGMGRHAPSRRLPLPVRVPRHAAHEPGVHQGARVAVRRAPFLDRHRSDPRR